MKVYIINSKAKSYNLNIKIRPLVTEYALRIKLVDETSSPHSFNPYAYFGHSWSYFDIQNIRLFKLHFIYIQGSKVHYLYFHTKIIPYIFHIKPLIFKTFSWSHSLTFSFFFLFLQIFKFSSLKAELIWVYFDVSM